MKPYFLKTKMYKMYLWLHEVLLPLFLNFPCSQTKRKDKTRKEQHSSIELHLIFFIYLREWTSGNIQGRLKVNYMKWKMPPFWTVSFT